MTETEYLQANLFSFFLDTQLDYISEPSLEPHARVSVIKYKGDDKCHVQVSPIEASHMYVYIYFIPYICIYPHTYIYFIIIHSSFHDDLESHIVKTED